MNKRRKLVVALGAGALATLAMRGNTQTKIPKIGVLSLGSFSGGRPQPFTEALQQIGWVEGVNIAIEQRWTENDASQLPALAQELVDQRVRLIVAWGTVAVEAAKRATTTVPIVMGSTADPVGSGFVKSLARPEGNITGVSLMSPELGGKRLQLLRDLVPGLREVAFLAWGPDPAHKLFVHDALEAGRRLGINVRPFVTQNADEIESALVTVSKKRLSAIIVQPRISSMHGKRTAEIAIRQRLVSISDGRRYAEDGGLVFYGPDRDDLDRRVAIYVDKILKGSKPGELPIEQPRKFNLVVNMKTAKALGLTIPNSILVQATKVIE